MVFCAARLWYNEGWAGCFQDRTSRSVARREFQAPSRGLAAGWGYSEGLVRLREPESSMKDFNGRRMRVEQLRGFILARNGSALFGMPTHHHGFSGKSAWDFSCLMQASKRGNANQA